MGSYADHSGGRTLAGHWDGTAWTRAARPSPGGGAGLSSITAGPLASARAVGQFSGVGGDKAFAVRYRTAAPA